MLGMLFKDSEVLELQYLIKRELEELALDIDDLRLNQMVRRAMEERYQALFQILKRFTPSEECFKYIRSKNTSV